MRESNIQKQIINYLTKEDWIVVKLIQTNWNGIPDLMALKNGRTVFIEVKQPGKKPNDLQQYRIEKLHKAGFEAFVSTSVNEVSLFLALVC